MQHIFFIGYRGSGKTSVGEILAAQLAREFLDTDAMIQAEQGRSIQQIFADDGQEAFRDFETQTIRACCDRNVPAVVSLGGGAILRAENRELFKCADVIWLRAAAEVLAARISQDPASEGQRPGLSDAKTVLAEVELILAQREPLYTQCADMIVETADQTARQIADIIARQLFSNNSIK